MIKEEQKIKEDCIRFDYVILIIIPSKKNKKK